MAINQGDLYWVQLESPIGAEPRIPHPYVVLQDTRLNHSQIATVVACAVTSNLQRISLPGNVLLDVGEANLPRHSVVEVAKIITVAKTQLGDYIGTLSERRIHQILAGIRFIQTSFLSTIA
ncbi:MAG: type II toxin-antitoxin system PemK/MazF family toxin [Armatimonadetes bacterium]|nr:type II toxin-antitoxin system PemK/MazF family toxin [Anaerolineae bacterium]